MDIGKSIVASAIEQKPLTVESFDNHVYFYSDVTTDRVLALMQQIRMIDDRLRNERFTRQIPEGYPLTPIYLHINSGGGDLFAGLAVADQMPRIQTPVYTIIEGLCASAATLISIVGQRRFIQPSAVVLIHQFTSFFYGSHEEFKDEEKLQTILINRLVGVYSKQSKIAPDELRELLKHNYWMDAGEALEHGLVDEVL